MSDNSTSPRVGQTAPPTASPERKRDASDIALSLLPASVREEIQRQRAEGREATPGTTSPLPTSGDLVPYPIPLARDTRTGRFQRGNKFSKGRTPREDLVAWGMSMTAGGAEIVAKSLELVRTGCLTVLDPFTQKPTVMRGSLKDVAGALERLIAILGLRAPQESVQKLDAEISVRRDDRESAPEGLPMEANRLLVDLGSSRGPVRLSRRVAFKSRYMRALVAVAGTHEAQRRGIREGPAEERIEIRGDYFSRAELCVALQELPAWEAAAKGDDEDETGPVLEGTIVERSTTTKHEEQP